jgi:hypothetical protein
VFKSSEDQGRPVAIVLDYIAGGFILHSDAGRGQCSS